MIIVPIAPMERMQFAQPEQISAAGAQGTTIPFANVLKDAMSNLNEVQATATEDSFRLAVGDVNDIAQMQTNSMKLNAVMETTVQLTTRTVNAYKEIMQMQV